MLIKIGKEKSLLLERTHIPSITMWVAMSQREGGERREKNERRKSFSRLVL